MVIIVHLIEMFCSHVVIFCFRPAITFNSGEGTKVIQFSIIADSVPELTEFFTVNLTSVSLITPKTLNQTVINGIQIDTPPMVGPQSTVEISINANDNPFGEVAFLQSEKLVHESDGNISVPVNRTGEERLICL